MHREFDTGVSFQGGSERVKHPTVIEQLEARLASWERERDTNKHGMAPLATRAIELIREDLDRRRLVLDESHD